MQRVQNNKANDSAPNSQASTPHSAVPSSTRSASSDSSRVKENVMAQTHRVGYRCTSGIAPPIYGRKAKLKWMYEPCKGVRPHTFLESEF